MRVHTHTHTHTHTQKLYLAPPSLKPTFLSLTTTALALMPVTLSWTRNTVNLSSPGSKDAAATAAQDTILKPRCPHTCLSLCRTCLLSPAKERCSQVGFYKLCPIWYSVCDTASHFRIHRMQSKRRMKRWNGNRRNFILWVGWGQEWTLGSSEAHGNFCAPGSFEKVLWTASVLCCCLYRTRSHWTYGDSSSLREMVVPQVHLNFLCVGESSTWPHSGQKPSEGWDTNSVILKGVPCPCWKHIWGARLNWGSQASLAFEAALKEHA